MQHRSVPFQEAVYTKGDACEGPQGMGRREALVSHCRATHCIL